MWIVLLWEEHAVDTNNEAKKCDYKWIKRSSRQSKKRRCKRRALPHQQSMPLEILIFVFFLVSYYCRMCSLVFERVPSSSSQISVEKDWIIASEIDWFDSRDCASGLTERSLTLDS